MGGRSISDRSAWQRGAGFFAFALLCILGIAFLQREGVLDPLNHSAMSAAGAARQSPAMAWLTPIMQAASAIGNTAGRALILLVGVCALLWADRRHAACWLVATTACGTLLNTALKQAFAAPRPRLLPHLDIVSSYSFPSGHAAGNMILFGALALVIGRRIAFGPALVAIALVGVSRVWLGVHWPSDVLAGWIGGIGWLALCRVWLPARGGEQQCPDQAVTGRHAVGGDEPMDPEAIGHAGHRDQQQ